MLGPDPEVGQAIEFSSDDDDENENEEDDEEHAGASQESSRSGGRGRGREVRQVGDAAHLTAAELGEEVVAAHTRSHDHDHDYDHDEQEGQDDQEDEQEEATPRAGSRSLPVVVEEAEEEEEEKGEADEGSSSGQDDDEEEENSSSDDDSDDESDDESEEEEEEDEDEEELDPELLLARALQSAQAKKSAVPASGIETTSVAEEKGQLDGEEEDVWVLDPEAKEREEKRKRERPIPGLELPKTDIPLHNLSLGPHDRLGKKRLERERLRRAEQEGVEAEGVASKGKDSKGKGKGKMTVEEAVKRGVEVDDAEYEKQLSRKEKLALPPRKTASQAWSAMPTIPSALLPQMKRDYQAMHLRDSLDPKRFMKGKTKSTVPEQFAIGTLVAPPRHLQSTTLTRERRYNPGDIVQSIVGDQELGGYAKRKFDDFAGKRMDHGRGKGWKKRKGVDWK